MISVLVLHRPLMLFCIFWALTLSASKNSATSLRLENATISKASEISAHHNISLFAFPYIWLLASAAAWAAVLAPLLPLLSFRLDAASDGAFLFVSRDPFWLAILLACLLFLYYRFTLQLAIPMLIGAFLAVPELTYNGFLFGGLFEKTINIGMSSTKGVCTPLLLLLLPLWPMVEPIFKSMALLTKYEQVNKLFLSKAIFESLAVLGCIHLLGLVPALLGVWAALRIGKQWAGNWQAAFLVAISTAFWHSSTMAGLLGSSMAASITWVLAIAITGLISAKLLSHEDIEVKR